MFKIRAEERMPWKFKPYVCSVSFFVSVVSTNEERKKRAERENDIYIYKEFEVSFRTSLAKHVSLERCRWI